MSVLEWVILAVVVVGVVVALFGGDRYRDNRRSPNSGNAAQPTGEVFLDPATGERMRVWYNAATGQRDYRPE